MVGLSRWLRKHGFKTLASSLALLGLGGALACKRYETEVSQSAYVVGDENDIVAASDAALATISQEAVQAAVLIATKLGDKRVKFCSGTLLEPEAGAVGNGRFPRVLTNHHCFAEADADGKATTKVSDTSCAATKVYFGFRPGHTAASVMVPCAVGSLRTDFEGDLAVFNLAAPAPAAARTLALWSGKEPTQGRSAMIVHFPDVEATAAEPPGGGVKLPTMALTLKDCRVVGDFPVSEWDLDRTLPFSTRHTCDLIHGSSGSGLIDVATKTVLGVNWGGIKISSDSGVRIDNVATRADYAAAFLAHDTTQLKTTAAERKASDADAQRASAERASPTRRVGKWCGVAAATPDAPLSRALLLLVLALPAGASLRLVRRRPDSRGAHDRT